MQSQFNIFLLLFGGLQGILLSVLLVRKKTYRSAYIFLLLYLLAMIFQVLFKVMSKSWLMDNMEDLYFLSYRFPYLYGPLAWLLTIGLLRRERKFHAADLLHFIPFLLALSGMLIYSFYKTLPPVLWIFIKAETSIYLQLTSLFIYHILALLEWKKYGQKARSYFSDKHFFQFRWLRYFIWISAIACTLIAIAVHLLYFYYPLGNEFRYTFLLLTVFIYWISYSVMRQPELFTVIKGNAKQEPAIAMLPQLVVHRPARKYNNSGLAREESHAILDRLNHLMETQKPFLDSAITIDRLAKMVYCSRHHLSQTLNDELGLSFYDYINLQRVNEAKKLLIDPAKSGHKIASIAYDAGFNSLSTFNDVFKKQVGQTPSQYRKDETGKQSHQQRV